MADSKNYIVRYDVQADTTNATAGLEALIKKANEVAAPMKRLQSTLQNTSKALFHLKQNANFEFNPTINVTTFQSQLRSMLSEVRTVATEMHAALYEALTSTPPATQTVSKSAKNAFKLATTTPELKKQLANTEKFLQQRKEEIKGLTKTLNTNLTKDQKTNAEKQQAIAKADSKMLQERIANIKSALTLQEEIDKKMIEEQRKTNKAVAKAAAAAPKVKAPVVSQPTPTTNVTPAIIKEWGKVFGDAKSKTLTVNIRGNASGANGAMTVIENIQRALKTLQSQAAFEINPVLNTEGFAAAEARLRQLAALSASVVAPFAPKDSKTKTGKGTVPLTKEEKTKLTNAQKQIKQWNEKIAPIQSRLDANKAIPENQRTPAIKGQITRDTKTLASYIASRAEQEKIVSTLQSKSSAAVQAGVKTAQPFVVDIVGNLSKINTPAKPPVIPIIGEISKIQSKASETIPVNVKISGDQVAASLKAIAPSPMLDVRVHILPEGIQEQVQAISSQIKPVSKSPVKSTAPTAATPPPPPAPRPVYTPPTFTAEDEKQLNNIAARYGSLAKEKIKAEKEVNSAQAAHKKSKGSNKTYDRFMSAQRHAHDLERQSTEVYNQLKPLMHKQFQSTAQRALTEEEIVKGIGAQNVVKQLESKKRLTVEQKGQLAEANKTLAALRAPAQPPVLEQPITPIVGATSTPSQPTEPEKPSKSVIAGKSDKEDKKKGRSKKPLISANVDTNDIIKQIANIPKQIIPVGVKLTWEKGAVGRQGQIKKLAEGIPPMPITLETTGAVGQLEEFIGLIKRASPQSIQLTVNGTPLTPVSTPTGSATSKKGKTTKKEPIPPATDKTPIVKEKVVKEKGKGKSLSQQNTLTILLDLNIAGAVTKLEEFVGLVRTYSPQTIQLTATGTPTKGAPSTSASVPSGAQPKPATSANGKKAKTPAVASTPNTPKPSGKTTGKATTQTQTIPLNLDTTGAIAKLEEFIAQVKAASPQTIQLTATGTPATTNNQNNTKTPAVATPPVAPIPTGGTTQKSRNQKGTTGHQPIIPRQHRDQIERQLAKRTPLPSNFATQIADQERRRGWQLSQMRRDAMAAFAQKTPFELAEEERLRRLAPTSVGTGRNKVVWGSTAPAANTAPKGYKWVKSNDLTPYLSEQQKQELNRLRGVESVAGNNVARIQSQIGRSTGRSNARLNAANAQFMGIEKQLEPYLKQMAQLEEMKKPLLSLKKLNSNQKKALARIESSQSGLQAHIDQYRQAQAPFAEAIRHESALMSRYHSMSGSVLSTAQQQHSSAQNAVSRYTDGYKLAPTTGSPSAQHVEKAERLRTQAHNAMLPFAQNKEQLNMLTKHRRYFREAVATTGIMPTPGMQAPQMLQYLQGVSARMQKASVPVPWTLQNQINKLEDQIATAKGIGQESAPSRTSYGRRSRVVYGGRPMSFYDRSRKWAYPFTGPSSFGVRTPMAVDMAKGMGVMFAIGGAMSAIGGSFSQAMEYQNTMRTTQAILQNGTDSYSQGAFQNMEATVRNVGVKTKFSAPEVASAARFLAMAGYDINAINDAIRPIADLALIGDSDLGETADKMTNIMTTFQIAPENMRQAANIMATTATRSNTDLMMLAESAKYGGGVANMYGRNDPNLFADTMALFGVMGNAGIQASSAGTALRMMYQNIFKPNKNQKVVLDMMKKSYGITTTKEDGSYRAMSDILIEMAQRIPENQMAQIVGNLFRITAQPGAAATLLAAAGGDQNIAEEIATGIEAMSSKMSSKAGLSSLVSLMVANRNSVNGNISGAIAEEKQNTIQGLWAQVTSTFTEGIVQAFEQRQGGFENILKKLRDYFAKPDTVQMLQNLMDMIIEIGKVMGWFVKIWANLYNAAPGMIKFWVVTQMAVTQMGTLIAPFISLLGVVNRLQRALVGFAGFSAVGGAGGAVGRFAGAGGAMAGSAAASAAMNAPFVVGYTAKGKEKVIRGNIAKRAHQAIANNARRAAMQDIALAATTLLPYPGGNTPTQRTSKVLNIPAMVERQNRINAENLKTREHYAAVQERARRIYGPARAGRAFRSAFTAIPTMAMFTPMLGGIKSMMMGLFASLAKAVGLLVNPITLAVAALAGLGVGLYKLIQRVNGNTDAQKASRAQANKAADQTSREMAKEGQWYKDMMNQEELLGIKMPTPGAVISSVDFEAINQSVASQERFDQLYASIFNDFSKNSSQKSIKDVANKWQRDINANSAYSLAIGNAQNYDFSKKHKQLEYNPHNMMANTYIGLHNAWYADEDDAINQRRGMVQDALMIEGAHDTRTQQALKEITDLRRKYLAGETKYKSQSEFLTAANAIRDKYMSQFTANIPAAGMTPEEFKENRDRSVFDTYQLGARNLLDATIEGRLGTTIGKMNAYQWLTDTKNKAQRYTDAWYNAISNIIGDYHVIYNAISADGKQQANVELVLSTLPNGQLNFTNILEQIRAKVNNFNLTVQGFSDIIGAAYKMMAEAGVIDIKDRNDFRNQIMHQMNGAKFNDQTPAKYYQQWIEKNSNSEWVKAGISKEKYTDFVMGRLGNSINLGNRVVTVEQERKQMWRNIAGKTADTILEQNKGLTEQGKKTAANTPTPTPPPTRTPINDQQAYASAYDHSAAKPTQIVFNINSLASFDRTTVASSAEERDLMRAMEDRIAGAVYQMFAEASNQAQRVMDLT